MHRAPALRSLSATSNYICPSCSRNLLRGPFSAKRLQHSNSSAPTGALLDDNDAATSKSWLVEDHGTDLKTALKASYAGQPPRARNDRRRGLGSADSAKDKSDRHEENNGSPDGGSRVGTNGSNGQPAHGLRDSQSRAQTLLEAVAAARTSFDKARGRFRYVSSGKTGDGESAEQATESEQATASETAQPQGDDASNDTAGRPKRKKRSTRATKWSSKTELNRGTIKARDLTIDPLESDLGEVPTLSYGLERVLFNPGFYFLQDPRSRVYNFDPYLEMIMPVSDFDFGALKKFTPSSQDAALMDLTSSHNKRYCGSTSSMTGLLSHFHYLLSAWRDINTEMLSAKFPVQSKTFTHLQRGPAAAVLRWNEEKEIYAIDSDKTFSSSNILSMLGISMEKLLTLETAEYERYRLSNEEPVTQEQRERSDSYHFSTSGDFMFRSQLDARDPRLPGSGVFDLKTRAVIPIRMAVNEYEKLRGYEIMGTNGEYESFEREYHDMIRATFLKYSMQVRMGRMDGIFVAYHNTERIFGFQYIPLCDMDLAVHGQSDLSLGDQEFKVGLKLLNRLLDMATERYPNTSLRILCEMRAQVMYFFAEPVSQAELEEMDTTQDEAHSRYMESFRSDLQRSPGASESEEALAEDKSALTAEEAALERTLAEEAELESAEIDSAESGAKQVADLTGTADPASGVVVEHGVLDGHDLPSVAASSSPESEAMDAGITPPSPEAEALTGVRASIASHSISVDEAVAEIDSAAAEQTAAEEDAEGASDAAAELEGDLAESSGAESQEAGAVFAVSVKVENQQNGSSVTRPSKIDKNSSWLVEYAIEEHTDPERRWKLYQACKRRRELLLGVSGKRDKYNMSFLQRLRELSKKGKAYRQRVTEEQAGKEKVVLGQWDAQK